MRPYFKRLLHFGREHKFALNAYRRAGIELLGYVGIDIIGFVHHLHVLEAGTVAKLYKAHVLAFACRFDPSYNLDLAGMRLVAAHQLTQSQHNPPPDKI